MLMKRMMTMMMSQSLTTMRRWVIVQHTTSLLCHRVLLHAFAQLSGKQAWIDVCLSLNSNAFDVG